MEKKDGDGGKGQSVLTWMICSGLFFTFITIAWSDYSGFSGLSMGLKGPKNILPLVELQRKVTHHQARAVSPAPSPSFNRSTSQNFSARHRKPTTIRKNQKLEQGLAVAREAIRKASINSMRNTSIFSNINVYLNPDTFYQSYAEMDKRFKVYVYEEGELPVFHDGPCRNIYSTEGTFIHQMEHGTNRFKTKDPHIAHVYFMPFSVVRMVRYLSKPNYDTSAIKQVVADYVRIISTKYLFWNRTSGADHFMLSCHDWADAASEANPFLYNTSIRVLCRANTSEGFNPQKDVSLLEISLFDGYTSPKLRSIPPANNSRPYLAFFAGGNHGPIRPILFQHWKDRDTDIRVYEYLPKHMDYATCLLQSKFCLCPSGYEVASPRIAESVYAECVPVILSENYVLPFSDVLNWEAFSIKVDIVDIPRLKEILMAVPEEKYLRLREGLRAVRRHFVVNHPPKKFDFFHMTLHSVWLRRLNLRLG